MAICLLIYLLMTVYWVRKRQLFVKKEVKQIFRILLLMNTFALVVFISGNMDEKNPGVLTRNTYGDGKKTVELQVSVVGEREKESIVVEVGEQEYTDEEIREIFQIIIEELDEVVLADNESFDYVDKPLNLVTELTSYPVTIQWEFSRYDILTTDGNILQENTKEEGALVELRGILSYGTQEAVYVANAKIYPKTVPLEEKWVAEIREQVKTAEVETRQQESFMLPTEVSGKELKWNKKPDNRGYYVLLFGAIISGLYIWNGRQDVKEKKEKERAQMLRDYPDIINQFTLLLSTGITVKSAWIKIIESYEVRKEHTGLRVAYEEMKVTYHEMQGGRSELEAYERFGKRCEVIAYMKFGALLSQNLRKGSKGLSQLLKMEAIQAFENRKSTARRMGEEASTKLMIPMFGMLAVVMIMIILPAFFSIQL